MALSSVRYAPVGQNEREQPADGDNVPSSRESEGQLPANPPEYEEGASDGHLASIEQMEFEELNEIDAMGKVEQLRYKFKRYLVVPVRERITDPLAVLMSLASHKVDFYLNKVGNPLILRRFVYVLFVSVFIYYVSSSGLLPNEEKTGTRGMFSDQTQLISYAKRALDLSKMESDLEFISSIAHVAGTKGDLAVSQYIEEAFTNNGLRLVGDAAFATYLNYPGNATLNLQSSAGQSLQLELTDENFNPLSVKGEVKGARLLYANCGSYQDFQKLADQNLITDNTAVVLQYDSYPGEQVMRAQEFGVEAVIFISDGYGEDEIDSVQRISVQNFRYSMGDPLTPGWSSTLANRLALSKSTIIPQIPTIPISRRQAEAIKLLFSEEQGVRYENGWFSGGPDEVLVNFSLEPTERAEHAHWSIVGKIEGREQNDRAIIISAARDAACTGSTYPNYGTATLLSLVQLFQQTKYKFGWKPLRNIYFISYDASQYGHAGATELLESEAHKIREEIYSILDISQLGIDPDSPRLDIQSHPMLSKFFENENSKMGLEIQVRDIQQFGDWSAYLANGIPAAILASPHVLERKYPIYSCSDTFDRLLAKGGEEYWTRTADVVLYVFQTALKLIDEPMVPFDIENYVAAIEHALQNIQQSAGKLQLDFKSLTESIDAWKQIGQRLSSWVRAWNNIVMVENGGLEPSLLSVNRWTWNRKIANLEKHHCASAGIPNRPFFKNVLFGPPFKNQISQGSWTFPGIRDAIFDGDQARAQDQIALATDLLRNSAVLIMENAENVD
ncbi:LADA_0C06282g1_1 [Lachancea dasiensis]|uniref:LADA_0C06282g1_1 n=1 Tax=Lachancea dasiensis TaxID=1072105 RepID=A0A1G4IZC9_9SACH|nr:LADA_0C06282g1_1 [Lachancea dasiensis]